MKSLKLLLATPILVCGYLLPFTATASEWKEKAEAEGKVVFYATFSTEDTKAFTGRFKQLYPKIDAQFYRTSDSQLMERILTEARAGRFLWDVALTTSFYGHALKKKGLLAPYDSPERKFYRDGYKDPQAMWTSTYTNYAAFGYHTRLVPKATIPKSHSDLVKPEWKGQIEGTKPAFAPPEVFDNIDSYIKLFHEIFGGR